MSFSGIIQDGKVVWTNKKYLVLGEAHGDRFNETFDTEQEATDFASEVIDGDVDSNIRVESIAGTVWTSF